LPTLALAGFLCACNQSEAPPMQALPVTYQVVQPTSVPYAVEVMAQTEGAKETEVRAQVGGVLVKQFYVEGEKVKKGQPLFEIDRRPYEIAVAEARARAEQTARDFKRMKSLLPLRGVSQKDYDDAESANQMAQAALRQAQLDLSWSTVVAPVSGISGRAVKSVGNLITVGTDSLLTAITQNDPMWVRFSLAESEIAKLPGGKLDPADITAIELVLPNGQLYTAQGKMNFLASTIDTVLGTRQLRAEFDNPDDALLPGQFVRARLIAGEHKGIFLVPQAAVVQNMQTDMLMTVGPDNKVVPKPVKLGDWHGQDWIVLSGLNPGDKIIVDNLMKLRPGIPVDPHEAASVAAPAPAAAPEKAAASAPAASAAPAQEAPAPQEATSEAAKPAAQAGQ
jgi:membrane fusion protein (multidrug efflux system)